VQTTTMRTKVTTPLARIILLGSYDSAEAVMLAPGVGVAASDEDSENSVVGLGELQLEEGVKEL